MGWKNVKDHYRISHVVQVDAEGICIGSTYIHNIIVIGMDGVIKKRYQDSRSNEDLRRYQEEMEADPDLLKRLVLSDDVFDAAVTVYSYEGGEILEGLCETPGWPNVTHAGSMMYENTHSTNRSEVVAWAKRIARLGVKYERERAEALEKELALCRKALMQSKADRAKLDADFPDIEPAQ